MPNIPEWTLGERLKKARTVAGLSQADLAARLRVARATISNAERDFTIPHRGTITRWCEETEVDETWVLNKRIDE